MKKNLTEIVFVLDRSGSMSGLEKDTIGGFNSFISKQRQIEGDAYVSVVLFDHETDVIYDRVPLAEVEEMTEKQYQVRGSTALLDAVGGAVHHIAHIHKYARKEDVPEKTIFVITTDGMENASKYYHASEVRRMIEKEQKKYGWEFLFMGANMDAVTAARNIGIGEERASRYYCDETGTELAFHAAAEAVLNVRQKKGVDRSWKNDLENDYAKRK